jgi:hypothetical protein
MTSISSYIEPAASPSYERKRIVDALHALPDRCVNSVEELARRLGAEKLSLIAWLRADVQLARLAVAKIST